MGQLDDTMIYKPISDSWGKQAFMVKENCSGKLAAFPEYVTQY